MVVLHHYRCIVDPMTMSRSLYSRTGPNLASKWPQSATLEVLNSHWALKPLQIFQLSKFFLISRV